MSTPVRDHYTSGFSGRDTFTFRTAGMPLDSLGSIPPGRGDVVLVGYTAVQTSKYTPALFALALWTHKDRCLEDQS